MGSIIEATCKCGFKSEEILAGGGMIDHGKILNAPALCTKCFAFTVENYYKKNPLCKKCKSKLTFYNNKSLWKDKNTSIDEMGCIFYWGIDNFSNKAFILPNTSYLCPKCRKFTMKFYPCGFWD